MNKKNKRNLILLLVFIVVLVVVFVFLKKNENADFMQEEPATEEESVAVVDINQEDVTDIEFIRSDGGSFTLHKEGDSWKFLDEEEAGALTESKEENSEDASEETQGDAGTEQEKKVNDDTVSTYLDSICALTAKQEIKDITDISEYGISEESDSVTLQLPNDLYVFRIGDYNSMAAGYYLTVNDTDSVYLIDSSTYYLLHKDSSYFEDTSEEEESESTEETTGTD